MKTNKNRELQIQRLREICNNEEVSFDSLEELLESVRTKKLHKRNNFHQVKINNVIERGIK